MCLWNKLLWNISSLPAYLRLFYFCWCISKSFSLSFLQVSAARSHTISFIHFFLSAFRLGFYRCCTEAFTAQTAAYASDQIRSLSCNCLYFLGISRRICGRASDLLLNWMRFLFCVPNERKYILYVIGSFCKVIPSRMKMTGEGRIMKKGAIRWLLYLLRLRENPFLCMILNK